MSELAITIPEDLNTAITKVGLAIAESAAIAKAYAPHWIAFRDAAERASDPTLVDDPKRAGRLRLELKAIRTSCDATRKLLKEDSLRRGQAIDGLKKHLDHALIPLEEAMAAIETAEQRREELRKSALENGRRAQLAPFCDATHFALGEMSEEAFAALLAGQKAAKAQRDKDADQAAAAAEQARKDREAAELADRQRRDTAAAAQRAETAKAQAAARKAEQEAQAARAVAAQLQAEKDAEAKAASDAARDIAEAARKRAAAPDRDKLLDFALEVAQLRTPELSTPEARLIGEQINAVLLGVVERIHIAADSL